VVRARNGAGHDRAATAVKPMPQRHIVTNVRSTTLDNGTVVLLEEVPWVHSASFGVWVRAGSSHETAAINGTSHLLEHLFFKGTPSRNARQIVETVERSGGTTNAFTGREHTCIYVKMLDTHLPEGIELLADILSNSLFCDIDKEKDIVLEEISSITDDPEEYVHDLFMKDLWSDHSFGFPVAGTREAVSGLGIEQIREFYRQRYRGGNIVISAAGNFDANEMLNLITRHFADIEDGHTEPDTSIPAASSGVYVHPRDIEQTHIILGSPGLSANDPSRFGLALLSTILGGNAMSRLFQRVREVEGLAYSVYTFVSTMERAGTIGVSAAVAASNLARATEVIVEEIERVRDESVPEDELRNAKEYLKGNITLGLEGTFNRMSRLAKSHLYRGKIETIESIIAQIERVQTAEIQQHARDLLDPARQTVTTLGPADGTVLHNAINRTNPQQAL